MKNKFTFKRLKDFLSLLFMLSPALLCVKAFAQTPPPASPFVINGSVYYQVLNNQLYQYNQDGSRSLLATYGNTTTHDLNAIGFNPKDSMIWGYNGISSNFFRMGSGGLSEYWEFTVAGVSNPANLFNVGTIDTNGYLYVYQSNQAGYFTIDLNPDHPTSYLKVINPANGTVKTAPPYATAMNAMTISDWAINPTDGFIYSVIEGHAPTVGDRFRVVRINPKNGTSALLTGPVTGGGFQQPADGSAWGYGSSFIDLSGSFYLFNNFNGIFYKVSNFTINGAKTATVVNNSGITGNQKNDGTFPTMISYVTTPLPVSLCCFQAIAANNASALLSWTTVAEHNNKGFEVQHSSNGADWNNKGFIPSKAVQGNSKNKLDYTFTDKHPNTGKNLYRLQQVDFDGMSNYSEVTILDFATSHPITLHPNPVITALNIEGSSPGTYIQVTDIAGKIVKEVLVSLKTTQIDFSSQPSGLYFIKAIDLNGEITRHKVLKL